MVEVLPARYCFVPGALARLYNASEMRFSAPEKQAAECAISKCVLRHCLPVQLKLASLMRLGQVNSFQLCRSCLSRLYMMLLVKLKTYIHVH